MGEGTKAGGAMEVAAPLSAFAGEDGRARAAVVVVVKVSQDRRVVGCLWQSSFVDASDVGFFVAIPLDDVSWYDTSFLLIKKELGCENAAAY